MYTIAIYLPVHVLCSINRVTYIELNTRKYSIVPAGWAVCLFDEFLGAQSNLLLQLH